MAAVGDCTAADRTCSHMHASSSGRMSCSTSLIRKAPGAGCLRNAVSCAALDARASATGQTRSSVPAAQTLPTRPSSPQQQQQQQQGRQRQHQKQPQLQQWQQRPQKDDYQQRQQEQQPRQLPGPNPMLPLYLDVEVGDDSPINLATSGPPSQGMGSRHAGYGQDLIMDQLLAVHNVNNLRKLLDAAGPKLEVRHYREALFKLGELTSEDPPTLPADKQHVQCILELVTENLRPALASANSWQLASLCCALAHLQYFDGPFLRSAMLSAMLQISSFTSNQAAGMLWALSSYKRSFKLELNEALIGGLMHQVEIRSQKAVGLIERYHEWRQRQQQRQLEHEEQAREWQQQGTLEQGQQQGRLVQAAAEAQDGEGTAQLGVRQAGPDLLQQQQQEGWASEHPAGGRSEHAICAADEPAPSDAWFRPPTATVKSYVQALYSSFALGHRPSAAWLQAFLHCLALCAEYSHPSQLASALWSLASHGCRPGEEWLQRMLGASVGRWGGCSGTHVSWVLWALARLRHAPDAAWMHGFLGEVHGILRRSSFFDLSTMAWALAVLRFRPSQQWTLTLNQELSRSLTVCRPEFGIAGEASLVLWAMVRLKVRPDNSLLVKMCDMLRIELSTCSLRHLALVMWSLQRLGYMPDMAWVTEVRECVTRRTGDLDQNSCVTMLSALAGYSHPSALARRQGKVLHADKQLVGSVCTRLEALCAQATDLNVRSCLTLLLALADLQTGMSSRQVHLYVLWQAALHLDNIPRSKLPVVCWATARIASRFMLRSILADLKLMQRIEHLVIPLLTSGACGPRELAQLAAGFAAAGHQPSTQWRMLHRHCMLALSKRGHLGFETALAMLASYGRLNWSCNTLKQHVLQRTRQVLQQAVASERLAKRRRQRGKGAPSGSSASGTSDTSEGSGADDVSPVAKQVGSHVLSSLDLLRLIVALVHGSCKPPNEWLQLHEACAAGLAQRRCLEQAHRLALLRCYQELAYKPRKLWESSQHEAPKDSVASLEVAQ